MTPGQAGMGLGNDSAMSILRKTAENTGSQTAVLRAMTLDDRAT
jgi:hypothetical protein